MPFSYFAKVKAKVITEFFHFPSVSQNTQVTIVNKALYYETLHPNDGIIHCFQKWIIFQQHTLGPCKVVFYWSVKQLTLSEPLCSLNSMPSRPKVFLDINF